MAKRYVKCPLCAFKDYNKLKVYEHMEKEHADQIPEGMGADQYWYNLTHHKDSGHCIICKRPTAWNSITHKYNRFCDNPRCKEIYREEFKRRMKDKYGKEHLLNDPDTQKRMLANRKISGEYIWSDGSVKKYTGKYELKFLEFCDLVYSFPADDILAPCPFTFIYSLDESKPVQEKYYTDEEFENMTDEERKNLDGYLFYIPDFYIPTLNLIIEIKAGGENPNKHPKIREINGAKDRAKAKVMSTQKEFNFIKITDNQFGKFATLVEQLTSTDNDERIVIIGK